MGLHCLRRPELLLKERFIVLDCLVVFSWQHGPSYNLLICSEHARLLRNEKNIISWSRI